VPTKRQDIQHEVPSVTMLSAQGHDVGVDDVRLGTSLRVLGIRKHLRQADVARRAGVRRETVGRLERGAAGRYPLGILRAVSTVLGADVDIRIRWQGADLDRITGAAHAELHESIAAHSPACPPGRGDRR
jgi:DNA-binding XRE family transcriptional regulator